LHRLADQREGSLDAMIIFGPANKQMPHDECGVSATECTRIVNKLSGRSTDPASDNKA
jgi:hypothetical protein